MTYVRFVVGGEDENFHLLDGVFGVARRLEEAGKLERHESELLKSVFAWFKEHLPCPPFQWHLRRGAWTQDAVSWFRSDAKNMLDRMWEIVALLKEKSVLVRFVTAKYPGRIVDADEYQIVAEAPL